MTEPISSDERMAAQDALNKLMASGKISPTRFRDAMRTAVTAEDRAEFDDLLASLPTDGRRWAPVPRAESRAVRRGEPQEPSTPTAPTEVAKRDVGKLAKDYLLPLTPIAIVYAFVLSFIGEASALYIPMAMGFWPLMLVCGYLIWRIRGRRRDDILFPPREDPAEPQDGFDADRA